MRFAAISDVHGNADALAAVLADIAAQDVTTTVNLGDVLSGGLHPARTADLLLPLGLPTVRGNHERQVLTGDPAALGPSDRLARAQLTPEHLDWLSSLPLTLEVAPGVLAFHGSPVDDLTYLLDTVEPAGARPATADEVTRRLAGYLDHDLLLCGHTHLPRAHRVDGGPLVVNPGSVGYPAYADDVPFPHVMEAGSPHARYAVLDDASGSWEVTFREVPYDWERAADDARRHGREDLVRPLLTGRV